MTEVTKKFIDEVNEFKKEFVAMIADSGMEAEELVIFAKTFKLLNTSMDLLMEQAEMMDGMNKKLDKLLVNTKAKS